MGLTQIATAAVERTPFPDAVTRLGVGLLVARARRKLRRGECGGDADFVRDMARHPIAENTADANAQHYELPADLFRLILGPHLKYSCCVYPERGASLEQAEVRALEMTCANANLADDQSVLELGCGWGSLSLWMARAYPRSRITSVSNSASQRAFIEGEARARALTNLKVITADMNDFTPHGTFDRIVSVEMFEHMSNWRPLLSRAKTWLRPDGRLFLHVFTHRDRPYRFDKHDRDDWIAQHFFTGGIMPSHGLIREFSTLFDVEADWRWSGSHYARTASDWLANFDRNGEAVGVVLRDAYGPDAALWHRRWRLFFLATAGLFGNRGGEVWGVSHYRLRPI